MIREVRWRLAFAVWDLGCALQRLGAWTERLGRRMERALVKYQGQGRGR